MQPLRRLHRHTYADYCAVESMNPSTKHEFLDGEIYAMSGGTLDHAGLAAEVLRALGNQLESGACRPCTSDLRIYVEAVGMATFPDGSVIGGAVEQHPPSPKDTALNPRVLLEVTSDSSEEYDTTTKLEAYRTIPSLRDYVIVSHRERRITVHHRGDDGTWTSRVAITGGRIEVASLAASLVVDEIYRRSDLA